MTCLSLSGDQPNQPMPIVAACLAGRQQVAELLTVDLIELESQFGPTKMRLLCFKVFWAFN